MAKKPYQENKDFIPEPTAQFGTLDTSGTAGSAHSKVEEISPVFEVAANQTAVAAARALDPNDTDVPASLVILPDSDLSHDDAVKRVKENAKAAEKSTPSLLDNRVTPAQEEAAESGDEAGAKADNALSGGPGAAGGADGSGSGASRKTASSDKK